MKNVFAFAAAVSLCAGAYGGSYRVRIPPSPPYETPKNASSSVSGDVTGFFHLAKDADGRWWFIDPKGKGVFPVGIQSATFNGNRCEHGGKTTYAYRDTNMRMFGSFDEWADDTCEKLRSWGFTMLGHGSSLMNRGFIEAPTAALGYSFWHDSPSDPDRRIGDRWPLVFPNVFNPDFERHCNEFAERVCAPRRDDPWLLGWFIDNEVSWRGTARGKVREDYVVGLFDTVAALPSGHSARKALDAFLASRGESAPEAGRDTKLAFLLHAAERYFSATTAAMRRADPNHLVLGSRFIQLMELEVWPVCAKWCDAISVNLYPWVNLDRGTLHSSWRESDTITERLNECGRSTGGKPILITEWSYLALDSGLPCTSGSGQRFYTQGERAEAAAVFARTMAAHPLVAGWTFFKWVDQPKEGISDTFNENGNYGLISEDGRVYPVAEALGAIQRDIAAARCAPPPLPRIDPPDAVRLRHAREARSAIMARADGRCSVRVRREGGRILVDNGNGLELELGTGEGTALRNVRFRGREAGGILYTRQERQDDGSVKWRPRWRVRSISFEEDGDGAVRLLADDLAFTVFPGVAEILCEGPEGARFEVRSPRSTGRRMVRPPHWNIWRPITDVAWSYGDGLEVTMRHRSPDVTVAMFGESAPFSSVSGFGKAKVWQTPDGIDVEPAVGAPWSGATLHYSKPIDISRNSSAVVSVTNLSGHALALVVGMADGNGRKTVCRDECMLDPHGKADFVCGTLRKTRDIPVKLKGMEGYGDKDGGGIPPSSLASLSVYQRKVKTPGKFRILSVRFDGCAQTVSGGASPKAEDFFPFCDRYGQYRHADWPGKVHSDGDLATSRREEERWLDAHSVSPIADADRFGGWAGGPKLAATGRFRVEKVDGRWWLVDPDGRLFFSHGIAGVRSGDASPVAGRERYFEWLPENAGKGVSFQAINLVRKYGADPDGAIERSVTRRRLRAWGINTIGNWSASNIWKGAQIPYTDNFATKARPIKGMKLAGNRMPDVFAPEFSANLAASAANAAARSGNDPWCIGWFVDNELSWGVEVEDLARTVLAAPADQPARMAFVKRLSDCGKTVDDALGSPSELADLTRFFAETYFRAVRDAIRKAAPGRMYLGCRFCSSRMNPVVLSVAAEYCDVISANIYRLKPTACAMMSKWGVDRPHLVGEFHFGALDRGMMHASLVPTRDQGDRAAHYRAYVEDALACDRIVGAHWFLYRDQALTGRKDGECLQCGFVDVADGPYPEMVEASRAIAGTLYRRRPGM